MGAIFHAQSENWIPQSHYVMRRNNPYPHQNPIPHSHYAAYPNWIPHSHDVNCHSQSLSSSPNFPGSRRRKRSPTGMNHHHPPNCRNHTRPKNLVMGQVKILKRGEQLPSPSSETTTSRESSPGSGGGYWNVEEMLVLCSTRRLGPDPDTVQKQIKLPDLSAFLVSPLPSSLPIPKFYGTKVKNTGAAICHLR